MATELAHEMSAASDRQRVADLQRSSKMLQNGDVLYTLSVPGIHCGQCVSAIERKLSAVPGITSVRANLSFKRVSATMSGQGNAPEEILKALDTLGYSSQSMDDETTGHVDVEFQTLVRALAVSGFAAANIMLLSVSVWSGAGPATAQIFHFLSALIAIPTVAYAGRPFFKSALTALKHHRMNMDLPISLGIILATAMSLYENFAGGGHAYFDAAVTLIFFLLIGRTLDYMMRSKARDAVERLSRLAAKGGLVVSPDGALDYLSLEHIKPGMTLRVAAGERIPIDGMVIFGNSDVDRSLVTGESEPLRVTPGMSLEAGTMNLTGAVDLRVERDAKDSFLADVLQMMQAAELGRGQYVRLADRMARLYSPMVHLLALATFSGWMIYSGGSWYLSLTNAISVLIITCPCALGLAVPVAHVLAASRLFSMGILMKDGSALERLAEIDAVAFDKTGTLTSSNPRVIYNEIPKGTLSALAKTLASRSVHPASRALFNSLDEAPLNDVNGLREIPGSGVEASYQGKLLRLGRCDWVAEIASEVGNSQGLSFAIEGARPFSVKLNEVLRDGAAQAVENFAKAEIEVEIFSGDNEAAVETVAIAAAIKKYHFALKPGDKVAGVAKFAADGKKILMVGDGLNDAPALSAAHVSMAPASASDTGRMAADFVFTHENLIAVWESYAIAKKTEHIVKENFALALLYNAIAVPLAIFGALNPLIAAVAMSSSSIVVVANSMRLKWVRIGGSKVKNPTSAASTFKVERTA